MPQIHEGGCHCGAVRFRAANEPVRKLDGELRTYEHRSDKSGRWLKNQFCPKCGSTVTWTLELYPGLRALAVGSFDDPDRLAVAPRLDPLEAQVVHLPAWGGDFREGLAAALAQGLTRPPDGAVPSEVRTIG